MIPITRDTPLSRADAMAKGKTWYLSPKPCKLGHYAPRRVDSGACTECYEMNKAGNQLRKQAGRELGNAIAAHLLETFSAGTLATLAAMERPYKVLHMTLRGGVDPGLCADVLSTVDECSADQVRAALACVPIQTDDGVLWALTAAGRAVGRAAVVAVYPGDAVRLGWIEKL